MKQKMITAFAVGSYGDVEPFIFLGKELKRRGHAFKIVTFPDHQKRILDNGLQYGYLHGSLEEMTRRLLSESGGASESLRGLKDILEKTEHLYEDFYESCKEADVVIYMQFGALAYHFAEKFNKTCVRTFVFPYDPTSQYSAMFPEIKDKTLICRLTYIMCDVMMNIASLKTVKRWRKQLGLSSWHLFRFYKKRNKKRITTIYQYSGVLAPADKKWGDDIHLTGIWADTMKSDYTPAKELIDFLNRGDLPIYIGFGSMVYGKMNELQHMIAAALKILNIRAVYVGRQDDQYVGGEHIYCSEFIPFDWLFPRVRAVVHHGGCGTTHLGLKYGRPTAILAFGGDQMFWGKRIAVIGAGPMPLYVNRGEVTVDSLIEKFSDLLNNDYDSSAVKAGAKISRERGVTAAADIVEEHLR